jgi:hypothetical protein
MKNIGSRETASDTGSDNNSRRRSEAELLEELVRYLLPVNNRDLNLKIRSSTQHVDDTDNNF